MVNGVTLSPSEQRLYITALRLKVLTTQEAISAYGSARAARKALVGLARKGYLLRIIRGMYGAVPPEHVGEGYEIDRYIIAEKAAECSGALGYHTALELHGVANSPGRTLYYLTPNRIGPFSFQGAEYRFVTTRVSFGATRLLRQGIEVSVTDRERTFLDCIRRPDLAGGLEELLKSLGAFHTVDTRILGGYLALFGERSLIQRSGVVLSLLKEGLRVPDEFLAGLKTGVGRRAYYLVPGMGRGTGRLDREWNVIVPKDIREVMRGV